MSIITDEVLLRTPCVDADEEEVGLIVELLEKELEASQIAGRPGVGLAAPQIGIFKNISIVRLGSYHFNLVNAKLIAGYDEEIFRDEGCLSFPGRVENTRRFQEIHLQNMAEPQSMIITGLLAVVCQHELDHTQSILLPDRAIKEVSLNKKVGPNDPCICGRVDPASGKIKKYKKCCGKQ